MEEKEKTYNIQLTDNQIKQLYSELSSLESYQHADDRVHADDCESKVFWEIERQISESNMVGYPVGSKVSKVGGDYRFDGVVVASFKKLGGLVRYVVEDDRGVLHIYGPKNLKLSE